MQSSSTQTEHLSLKEVMCDSSTKTDLQHDSIGSKFGNYWATSRDNFINTDYPKKYNNKKYKRTVPTPALVIFKRIAGLQYESIVVVHKLVFQECENLDYWGTITEISETEIKKSKSKLTSFQQLLLLLVRLHVGLLVEDIGYRFGISTSLVSMIATICIRFIYNEFSVHLKPHMFPSQRVISVTAEIFQP